MKSFLKLLLLVFFSTPLKTSNHELVFHGAYAFETFSSKGAAAVYVSIFNNSTKDLIIKSLSSEIAKTVEIHNIIIENEIVKMKKVDKLLVKAKDAVYMQPGGMHIMLMGLNKKLNDGSSFSILFLTEEDISTEVKVMVLNSRLKENFIN